MTEITKKIDEGRLHVTLEGDGDVTWCVTPHQVLEHERILELWALSARIAEDHRRRRRPWTAPS